jgi:Ser/Thr protein kinase RdoA (MazF antagonist)
MPNFQLILSPFGLKADNYDLKPLGNGLINDTYVAKSKTAGSDYVVQRINHAIFTDVECLQRNIEAVTHHIRAKLEAQAVDDIDRKVLNFLKADNGKTYVQVDGNYWRVMVFIPDAITYEEVTPELSYEAGRAFGNFQSMLADIPDKLEESIPDFHNIEFRLKQLREAVAADAKGRVAEVADELALIDSYASEMCKAEELHRQGVLPKRICHCDTKVNNMMFDRQGNVLCVIDLDTVMPSYIFSDYGDFLRTAANTGKEDDPNIDNVNFNMAIFEAFTKGYLEGAGSFLLPVEVENLPYGVLLFPYMQAVRFLADYINGDTYYKIQYPEHNLVRTKAQLKLFRSALAHVEDMKKFISQFKH